MRLERRILRWLNDGDTDIDLFESALGPRELPDRGPSNWFMDRARFLYTAFITAAGRNRANDLLGPAVYYDPAIRWDEKILEYRHAFIDHHFSETAEAILGSKSVLAGGARRKPSKAEARAARMWGRRARIAALLALLDFSSQRYYWWGGIFLDMQAFARVTDDVDHAYVFRLYDRRSYCIGTFLRRYVTDDVRFVYQGMPLWFNQRDLHVPVTVVVTSKVNVPEVEWFAERGHFKASSVCYRPQEFILDRFELTPTAPTYDIGFFASGDWARRGFGRYWSSDIEAIRRGDYRGTPFEKAAEQVLSTLADYAHKHGRTLRIYMHPYERMLLADHGIQPPYRAIEDGKLVTIDDQPGTSRDKVYEPAVAIAVRSSTIWERIDLDLDDSFIYTFGDDELDNFNPKSLGEYRRNVFGTMDELTEKLDEVLVGRQPLSPE